MKTTFYIKIIALVFIIFTTGIIWWVILEEKNTGILKVTFLDVGQGDSILIQAPNRNKILIDTGPNKKVLESLSQTLSFYDKSISGVLLTHPDLDHIGGTVPVFNLFEDINYLFISSSSKEKKTDVTDAINSIKGIQRVELSRGDKIILDPINKVYLEVLFPDNVFVGDPEDANINSIITKLVYGEVCFIFTGDAPKMVELYVISKYEKDLDCEVLKAGHHGSNTSTTEEFVGFVSPEYGIISAGKDNKFGHPHQEVLDVFNKFGVKILNTAEDGNIEFYSDGERVWTSGQVRGVVISSDDQTSSNNQNIAESNSGISFYSDIGEAVDDSG